MNETKFMTTNTKDKIAHLGKTDSPKITTWNTVRRRQLENAVAKAFPYHSSRLPYEAYQDTIKRVLGVAIWKRVERENDKANNGGKKEHQRKSKIAEHQRNKRITVARLGTEKQCDALAQEVIDLSAAAS